MISALQEIINDCKREVELKEEFKCIDPDIVINILDEIPRLFELSVSKYSEKDMSDILADRIESAIIELKYAEKEPHEVFFTKGFKGFVNEAINKLAGV